MAEHDADTLLFKMANSPYGIRFFRCQGHDPQRLPGASNQRIQLGDIQFTEQLGWMGAFILWRKVGRCCSNQGTIPQFGDLIS